MGMITGSFTLLSLDDGDPGAKCRMRWWTEGEYYLSGAPGEEWYDIVWMRNNPKQPYRCLRTIPSPGKMGVNDPVTSIQKHLGIWQAAQNWAFIATDFVLSRLIRADEIDADGIRAKDVNISGKITATEGLIGAFGIDGKGLHAEDSAKGAYISIGDENDWTTNSRNFFSLNHPASNTLMHTWSNYKTAFDARCSASGKAAINVLGTNGAYAIKSEGDVLLDAGVNGQVRIAGLSLAAINGSVVRNDINFYVVPNGTQYFNLPSPSTMNGYVLFVKLMGKTTVRSLSPIYLPHSKNTFGKGSDGYYWDTYTEKALMLLSNGNAWYCFGCYSY